MPAYGLLTVYKITCEIGTSLSGTTWTYSELGEGIDNLSEALNEVVQQYSFLSDDGFARNHVTGMAPSVTLTGRRVLGDTAQDYVFGKKYSLDEDRQTSLKLSWTGVESTPVSHSVTVDCTICNIQEWSGASTDDSAISFELRFDGAPTIV